VPRPHTAVSPQNPRLPVSSFPKIPTNKSPPKETYTWPGRGVIGYGCDTDPASTTTTVTTTYSGSLVTTAFVSTAPLYAVQAALLGTTTTSTSRYTYSSYTYTTRYTTYGGSSYAGSSASAPNVILLAAPLIAILVVYFLGYCCALAILIIMCRRSKRLVALWYQPGGVRGPPAAVPAAVPATAGAANVQTPFYAAAAPPPTMMEAQTSGTYYDPSTKGSPSPAVSNVYPVSPVSSPQQVNVNVSPPYGHAQPYVGGGYPAAAYQTPQRDIPQQGGQQQHELQ
jgi:hypothetical protein